jgi:hypothetical protein
MQALMVSQPAIHNRPGSTLCYKHLSDTGARVRRVLAGTMRRAAGRQRSGTAVATPCWAILTPKTALRAPMTGVRSPAAPASMLLRFGMHCPAV